MYIANTTNNIVVATRKDISNTQNKHKIWQNLKEKTKLNGKLNPCQPAEFFVRIVLSGEPGYLDSAVGTFDPDLVIAVRELEILSLYLLSCLGLDILLYLYKYILNIHEYLFK